MGADSLGVVIFMDSLGMSLSSSMEMDPVLVCIAVVMGVPAGNSVPWASTGVMLRGYLDLNFASNVAQNYSARIAVAIFATFCVVFTLMYFLFKGNKCSCFDMQKLQAFNTTQKKSLTLILTNIALLVIPQIFNRFFENSFTSYLAQNLHVYGLVYLFGFISSLLDLADEKDVIAKIPFGTILNLAGIMILIDLGTEAGLLESFAKILGNRVLPAWLIYAAVVLFSALMSMFSNSIMVAGIFMPFVKELGLKLGMSDPASLLFASVLGAYSSDIAPFSTGGALILAQCHESEKRNILFKKFFSNMFLIIAIVIVMAVAGWFKLF